MDINKGGGVACLWGEWEVQDGEGVKGENQDNYNSIINKR